jgi:hypothetical protein
VLTFVGSAAAAAAAALSMLELEPRLPGASRLTPTPEAR